MIRQKHELMADLKKIWEENTEARLKTLRFKPRANFDPN